jgi:hypothetical protein
VITSDKRLTKGQRQTSAAIEARKAAARRRRLDKAAALLAEAGWTLAMPDGTPWKKPGDAR